MSSAFISAGVTSNLTELDETIGELTAEKDLGLVGGAQDLQDQAEDMASDREEFKKKEILKKCFGFMKKRLDFYLSQGIDISYIAMTDPFIIKSNEVDDILDYVDVEDSLCS